MKKNPITAITIILFIVSLFLFFYTKTSPFKERYKELDKEMKTLKSENDSLKSEIFVKDITIGRYEHIMDMFETELDSTCKKKVDEIISQTE